MCTLTGELADRIERFGNEDIAQEIVSVFHAMFPKKKIPHPTKIMLPRWGMDPLFYGSFTSWPIGMSDESWINLVTPLDKKVFFGGEMASKDYFGYVHGGYVAGIEQAKNVIKCMNGDCSFKFYPKLTKAHPEAIKTSHLSSRNYLAASKTCKMNLPDSTSTHSA